MNWWKNIQIKIAGALPEISEHEAVERKLFGPVYHGTSEENRQRIGDEGFKVFIGDTGSSNISNGYDARNGAYHNGIPAPVHHTGYGVYFTTIKSIAKQFAGGTAKGMETYYLDIPRLETINFGAPRTMMKWWIDNGYDPKLAMTDRVLATARLTATLKSKYDAVWFKGKSMYKLLDGDQVCVFDPTNKVFVLNNKLSLPGQIGSKVRRKADGMIGVIMKVDGPGSQRMKWIEEKRLADPEFAAQHYNPQTTAYYYVKWKRGGTDYNCPNNDVDLL